ncbi:ABC-2 family transporter protein [Oscillospiraceae bacterium PP1C4]
MGYVKSLKRLIGLFIKTSLQQDMAFRIDFAAKLLNTAVMLLGSVGGILILFSIKQQFNGWGFFETLTVTGIFMFIQSFKNLFISPSLTSISGLGGELWTGSFDYTLLKPLPTRFYISIRNWSPLSMLDIIISIVVICISVYNISVIQTAGNIISFVLCLLIALLVLYSIMLILASAAFWYLGTPLLWILDSLMELGRYPVKIYPALFQNLLTWVIPVGVMVSLPAEVLLGRAKITEIIGGMVLAVSLYFASVLFFRASLKKYSSASS